MTDSTFRIAGCTMINEENSDQKIQLKQNTSAHWRLNQIFFRLPTQSVNTLDKIFSNVLGKYRVCPHFVGNKRRD